MAFCPKCGSRISGTFCTKCGAKGGGGGAAANITYSVLAAVCFIAVGAIALYNIITIANVGVPIGVALVQLPLTALCFYLGYETYNKKAWAQPWGVASGIVMFLGSLSILTTQGVGWLAFLQWLLMGGIAVFAYLGKAEYTIEDKESPFAKLTQ